MSRPRLDTPVAVFLHSADYDRMHQGLSIAATAVAAGRRADVFFFWWALERLFKGELDEPDFARGDVAARFERRQMPTLRELLAHLRESGLCTTYACTASVAALGRENEVGAESGMTRGIDQFVGWSTILQLTAGVTDRFYL